MQTVELHGVEVTKICGDIFEIKSRIFKVIEGKAYEMEAVGQNQIAATILIKEAQDSFA